MFIVFAKPQFKSIVLVLCLFAAIPTYAATLLLEENFNFTGNLNANGWDTHSATGTNPSNTTTGLSYLGYPSSGIGNAALLDNTGEDANRTFVAQSSGILYTSFLLKANSNTTVYFLHLSQGSPNISFYRGRIFVGSDGTGDFELGLSVGSNTFTLTNNDYIFGTTYLVVLKYEFVPGIKNDKVSLFVFASDIPTNEPATATLGPLTDTSLTDPSEIGSIALRQHEASQNVIIDGIRIGDSWSIAPGVSSYTLTLNTAGLGDITGSTANGTYLSGTPITLMATATNGSTFIGWNPANCTNGFTLVADTTCTAVFEAPIIHYHLSMQTAGTGNGSINGGGSYMAGTSVVLTALPNAGSTFVSWNCIPAFTSGDPLTADTTCTATFTALTGATHYHLSVQTAGTGNGLINGAGSYPAGTAVALTAIPDGNSIFTGWSVGCSDKVVLMADTICTATFVAKTVTPPPVVQPQPIVQPQPTIPKTMDLHIYLGGDGQGHITSQPGGIDCHVDSRDCDHTYDTGTYVKLTATAAPGSKFWVWGGNDDCEDGQVSLYGNRYCTAYFHLLEQPLTVTRSGTGDGTVKTQPTGIDCGTICQAKFSPNTLVYLVATPAAGSQFVGYSGDQDCGDGVVKLAQAKTCHAIFEASPPSDFPAVTYTLNVSIQGHGHVISTPAGLDCGVACTAYFASGTHINLTAQAGEGSMFSHFSGDAGCADGHFNLENHQTCVAHFAVPILPTELKPGVATFVLSNYEIREGAGTLNIAVKREGGSDGILMVNYATVDGHIAKSGLDFMGAQGALVWNDGDTADKTIVITLLDHKEISEEEVLEGEEVFHLVLTNVQGGLIDTAMISLLHEVEVVASPPVVMPTPAAVSTPVVEDHCPPALKLEASCDAKFQTVGTLEVTERGYLANAIIEGDLTNRGWVANLQVKSTATVTGGTVTGYIENAGIISDFRFRGRAIVGGILSGVIHNTSVVGGYFQDVHLAANTQIIGGLLTGEIVGDCAAPAVVDNVRILRGSHLVCIVLGERVVFEENVSVNHAEIASH